MWSARWFQKEPTIFASYRDRLLISIDLLCAIDFVHFQHFSPVPLYFRVATRLRYTCNRPIGRSTVTRRYGSRPRNRRLRLGRAPGRRWKASRSRTNWMVRLNYFRSIRFKNSQETKNKFYNDIKFFEKIMLLRMMLLMRTHRLRLRLKSGRTIAFTHGK